MGYCKHDWKRRNAVLQTVFSAKGGSNPRDFYVCLHCLKIRALRVGPSRAEALETVDQPVGASVGRS